MTAGMLRTRPQTGIQQKLSVELAGSDSPQRPPRPKTVSITTPRRDRSHTNWHNGSHAPRRSSLCTLGNRPHRKPRKESIFGLNQPRSDVNLRGSRGDRGWYLHADVANRNWTSGINLTYPPPATVTNNEGYITGRSGLREKKRVHHAKTSRPTLASLSERNLQEHDRALEEKVAEKQGEMEGVQDEKQDRIRPLQGRISKLNNGPGQGCFLGPLPSHMKIDAVGRRHTDILNKGHVGVISRRTLTRRSYSFSEDPLGSSRRFTRTRPSGTLINTSNFGTVTVKIDSPDKIPPIRIFRRVARLVRLLCSVCIALKSYAIGKGLLDDYLVLISHRRNMGEGEEGGVEELTFNLKDFKIKKELEVPEATVNVLIKRPEDRTPEDITTIARLMRRLPSFRKYTREMQQLFCKIVRYMKCQQNRVVLRKGHIGYSLYFIYTGACSVVLDKDDTNIFIKKEVIILRKGACFGEIALVQNTRRNSTVVCTEDTEFLVVDKHLFLENGLNLQMEQEFTFRYNIFRRLPMMSHWSSNMVHELSNVSRTEEFVYNKVIVSDSTLNDWLWFVIKGSCDIIRLVELEKCPSFQHLVEGSPTPLANNHISLEDLAAATRRSLVKPTQSAKVELTEDEVKEEEVKEPEKPKRSSKWGVLSGGMFGALIDDGSTNKVETDSNSLEDISEIDTVLEAIKSVNHLDDIALKVINSAKAKEEKKTDNARQEEPKDVGYGLFFKVDTLRDGQCFGLDMIKEDKPINTRSFALISRGCEVIHVPKTRFREIADEETIRKATKLCKEYPADDILCERFIHRCRWNSYKYGVVEDVMTHRVRSGSVQSINSVQTPSNEHLMPKPTTQDELEAADIREAMRYKDEMSPSTDGLGQNHRRPHTSYGLCGRKAKAKQKADAKASWEMNLDLMRSTGRSSGSRDRPHTCPPSVSRSLIASMSSKGHKKKPSPPAGLEIEKVLKSEKIDADGESPLPKGESPIPKAGSIAPASKWCKMGGIKSYFKGPPRSVQIMADLEAGAVED